MKSRTSFTAICAARSNGNIAATTVENYKKLKDAGIDDVGCGVLFGLNNYKYDFVGMLMHAHHLEKTYGCGPHTISVPRIRPADDIDPDVFDNGVPDDISTTAKYYVNVSADEKAQAIEKLAVNLAIPC